MQGRVHRTCKTARVCVCVTKGAALAKLTDASDKAASAHADALKTQSAIEKELADFHEHSAVLEATYAECKKVMNDLCNKHLNEAYKGEEDEEGDGDIEDSLVMGE